METFIFADYYFALNRIKEPGIKLNDIYYYEISIKN
jgi:hypothetical protein